MLVTRVSPLTGRETTLFLSITPAQWASWHANGGPLKVQEAFPSLTADEREFLMTGLTMQDWEAMYGEDDDEDDFTDA